MRKAGFFFWVLLGISVFAFAFFNGLIILITDLWWFAETGFTDVFLKSLGSKIIVFVAAFLFSTGFLLVNFLIATSSKIPWLAALPEALFGQPVTLNNRFTKRIAIFVSIGIGLFVGLIASLQWLNILQALTAVPFIDKDPIFAKNIAFYIFHLPVLQTAAALIRLLLITTLIGCGLVYILRGSLNLTGIFRHFNTAAFGLPKLNPPKQKGSGHSARLHLGILLSFFFASLAFGVYLSLFQLLSAKTVLLTGASYTDMTVMIPLLRLSLIALALVAITSFFWGIAGATKPLIISVGFYVLVGVVTLILPFIVQKLIVAPNELVKETPFIRHNIAATRKAFGLDMVEEREISAERELTAQDVAKNPLTVKNVRLWDRAPLLSTFSQIQEIRTYYEFTSVDNDRYIIDRELRQIMLSPRELASDTLPSRTWINERLTFTHGYGVTAGPVNQVTHEGLPVLFVKDLPPKTDVPELSITRPEIYYGELANDYVIVKTRAREFDYPKGEENVYITYEGKGGVQISSPIRRLLFALRFGSLKLLLSNDITSESRIMYYRNVKERVAKIAPFLDFDRDPYMAIAEGKLYWIIDAYTTSSRYPYSQILPYNASQVNYIRNSVKVVIDTYNGTITFYTADENDPIVTTFSKIFPTLFHSLSQMPQDLQAHLRYPEDIFTLQTNIYTIYHMDDPQIFYNKEDQWEIPAVASENDKGSSGTVSSMSPRHMIMKLPNEPKEEYILMLPFTPKAKDNLAAWMVARNDGEQYGKLLVYRFPKQKLVFGPKQIIGRINQDAEISQQISLWDQRGSQVIQGPLLVIPIEESLIYVRPLYLKAEVGKIPELKRVIVAYENRIAMEETLEAGLGKIFGSRIETDKKLPDVTTRGEQLIREASQAYEAALQAQREGNWSRYGEEIRRVGEILRKLQP